MSKRTANENLKSLSIIYIILAVLDIGALAICNLMPDVVNMFKTNFGDNVMIEMSITIAVSVILYLWYFWLARRVADGKSNGMLLMILLVMGIAGSLVNAFVQRKFAFLSLDVIADICALYYLYQVRKESQNVT